MEEYNLLKNKENVDLTEVSTKNIKRQYSKAYKKKIVELAHNCREPGDIGTLLRKEGLRSSTVHRWRRDYANGCLRASSNKRRGPEAELKGSQRAKLERLEKANAVLQKKLARAEAMMELQKKMAKFLESSAELARISHEKSG